MDIQMYARMLGICCGILFYAGIVLGMRTLIIVGLALGALALVIDILTGHGKRKKK